VRAELMKGIQEILGPDYDVETHFNPRYRPWQQRIAFVPDGDLFHGIAEGKASVVTDHIREFTETGILLESGDHLDADIVITATGFDLSVLGDIEFSIDGGPLDFANRVTWRGMMFTGVPNLVWIFGYFRASWTLRVDLVADLVCRLLEHLDELGAEVVVPRLRPGEEDMALRPWVDPEDFNPGYLTRSLHLMPKQGDHQPWLHTQDYWVDKTELPEADLDDGSLAYH
jgi:cation diffusion facilitator CzcD-associated flavoprotein CzcO